MLVGSVRGGREPGVQLRLIGPAGQSEEILAVIDTGFNGTLAMPPTLADWLSLEKKQTARVRLAYAEVRLFDRYNVQLLWDGRTRNVLALAMGEIPIIGMALLKGYRLTMDVVDGGLVTIEALL
jgi:clan AA aspartic protease